MTGQRPDPLLRPVITDRAARRMREMGVTEEVVSQVLRNPRLTWWTPEHGCWLYQGEAIALGVACEGGLEVPVIVTVLYRSDDDWASKYDGGRR